MTTRYLTGELKARVSLDLLHVVDTPTSYTQAAKHDHWHCAMTEEYNALLQNGTWVLIPPPSCYNVIGCKLVHKVKQKLKGSIDRYKARLVAKGFHQ